MDPYTSRPDMEPQSALLGQQLEQRGDAEVYVGDLAYAKVRYGRAIDAYLEARYFEAAIRTCRKLIRLAPDVVRTHYTLAYLLIGDGDFAGAEEVLRDYHDAVAATSTHGYAVPRLRLLAHVTGEPALRARISRILRDLAQAPEPGQPAPPPEPEPDPQPVPDAELQARWERLLPVALRDSWTDWQGESGS